MKRILNIFAVVVILTALSAPSAQAGNDERRGTAGASELLINPWTRSTGWGGVNIANVRGLESMFGNVAGLAFIDNVEVAYSNTMLYGGRKGLTSGATINTFGLGVRVFEAEEINAARLLRRIIRNHGREKRAGTVYQNALCAADQHPAQHRAAL